MSGRARLRRFLVQLHLWLGLTVGALWALQGLTGALLVFHRELDRALLPGTVGSMVSLDRVRDAALAVGAPEVARIGIRDGARDVLTVDWKQDGHARTLLVDATTARPLLERDADPALPGGGGTSRWLYTLHERLLLGDRGETLIGISGLLLITAALTGAWLGWPRGRGWRTAFRPSAWRNTGQRLYGWHRGSGLLLSLGLPVLALAGVWMIFAAELKPALAGIVPFAPVAAVPAKPVDVAIGPEAAWQAARKRFPEAVFVRVTSPTPERAAYVVRLLQPGEVRAWSGTTSVTVSPADGRVVDLYDPLTAPIGSRLADAAFAVHNGEIAGVIGRVLVMLAGLSLPMLYVTGVLAWLRRRRRRVKSGGDRSATGGRVIAQV